jgi:hypothetical protein
MRVSSQQKNLDTLRATLISWNNKSFILLRTTISASCEDFRPQEKTFCALILIVVHLRESSKVVSGRDKPSLCQSRDTTLIRGHWCCLLCGVWHGVGLCPVVWVLCPGYGIQKGQKIGGRWDFVTQ